MATTCAAEILNTSAAGFCAAHESDALVAGLEVRYQGENSSGCARVIWTHILHGQRVSGFLLLQDGEPITDTIKGG